MPEPTANSPAPTAPSTPVLMVPVEAEAVEAVEAVERPERVLDATVRRLERGIGTLTTAATLRMDADLPWYRALAPQERTWVGAIARAGISEFVAWYAHPSGQVQLITNVFGAAPPELTRAISLQQTLDLLRTVVDVVEDQASLHAVPGAQQSVREAVLRFSREVAFAAAEIYAGAAEARGAWDARLEALIVDALLRADDVTSLHSRAAALGWAEIDQVAVLVGVAPPGAVENLLGRLRSQARALGADALVSMDADLVVLVLGKLSDPMATAGALADLMAPGPVVLGPVVSRLGLAHTSARAAMAGIRAARARPEAPRPVAADDLLPERVLMGDASARTTLLAGFAPLSNPAHRVLLETASTYLRLGSSLEATARHLYVHANTVRYRLRRVAELTGWDPTQARAGHVLQIAITLGLLLEVSYKNDV